MEREGNKWIAQLDKDTQDELNIDIENKEPVYYGYRAWGPNWQYNDNWEPGSNLGFLSHVDDNGNRFNPNKLLIDPYAMEISHDPISPKNQSNIPSETVYATGHEYYLEDSAPIAPKSVFTLPEKIDTGVKPRHGIKDDVIYEVHLRGFTKAEKNIPENYRGTYAGAAMKAKYLKSIGITMVEFLPVQEFDDDKNDFEGFKNKNYWGYQTINYFSPNRRYSSDKTPGGPTREFKEMVKAFHDAGIKVCLDVVYNHSGEGGIWNDNKDTTSLYSMRGFDNQSYYELKDNAKRFRDDTGCGGNMNVANPLTKDLVVDSLKYWAEEMGVDAFRFDLAPILGNVEEKNGFSFDPKSGLLRRIEKELKGRSDDGKEGSVDLIAEPWSCSSFNLGNFPQSWKEWNGKYRDSVRKLFNAQERTPFAEFTSAVAGSSEVFGKDKTRSVNFITCHDGFTLKDLFSYNYKNNNIKGFSSDGGSDDNISWDNFGDPVRQVKAVRNAITTLMLSKGTPMLLGGDEFMRTQLGNNNAYCLDTPKNYLNWDLNNEQKAMQEFTKRAIEFRKNHEALKNLEIYEGKDHNNNKLKDITWLKEDAKEADVSYLNTTYNNFLGFRIDGSEFNDSASSIYTVLNKGDNDIEMVLPKNLPGKNWYLVADTSEFSEIKGNFAKEGDEIPIDTEYVSLPRSIMVFIEK